MKIVKIDIPKSEVEGLDDIKMNKLGNVVLLAGRNGSGKSRILNKIFNTLTAKPTKNAVESTLSEKRNYEASVAGNSQSIKDLKYQLPGKTLEQHDHIQKTIQDLENSIESYKKAIEVCNSNINWKPIETTELSNSYPFVRFVPKRLDLQNSNDFTKSQNLSSASSINSPGVENLTQGTLSKIQVIQDRWFNANSQLSEVSAEEVKEATQNYERLQNIIEAFLNTKIGRTLDGEPKMFGFPIGQANLSDGQKILLQYSLAIYSQEVSLKDMILILDEPENHLHPSVIIETIERILKCASNGQLWIATHSIPLLAHFDPAAIWFVEDGKIRHAGKIPEKVLSSLIGNDEDVAKLQDFISLPSQFAASRYAFESLIEPKAVTTEANDPQSIQIKSSLLKIISANGKLRVLDYGAGKGRLISNIVDSDESRKDKLIDQLDYIAFDKFQTDKNICEASIVKAYGHCDKRFFSDYEKLTTTYDKGTFDVIVMCNVLHEIDPKFWLDLFKAEGEITALLKDNGTLLIVEDHEIPIGEKAYQNGFLVMDSVQLKELFCIKETDSAFFFSEEKEGRLKAHHIAKEYLGRINENSKIKALKSMSEMAKKKILDIRSSEAKNYSNGKRHGFWTQQFANAQLSLSELTSQ